MEYQVDIGFAQNIKSPNYQIVAHQTGARIGVPNKAKIHYSSNDYLDQYRDLEVNYKEHVGKELLSHFIHYTDTKKNIYPIEVNDLRFQVEHVNPEKN